MSTHYELDDYLPPRQVTFCNEPYYALSVLDFRPEDERMWLYGDVVHLAGLADKIALPLGMTVRSAKSLGMTESGDKMGGADVILIPIHRETQAEASRGALRGYAFDALMEVFTDSWTQLVVILDSTTAEKAIHWDNARCSWSICKYRIELCSVGIRARYKSTDADVASADAQLRLAERIYQEGHKDGEEALRENLRQLLCVASSED